MKIISHRGSDGIHKENSMDAILNSLKSPYTDGVEFDIRITKDHKFIINHDPFYKGYLINKTHSKTLKQQGLDTLEEVLKHIHTNKIILIEIKEERQKYKILTIKLNRLLKKYNLNYYIQSFNYNLMKYLKQKYPHYKTGLLIGLKLNIDKINNNFDFNSVNTKYINKCPNKETFLWNLNNKFDINKLKPNQNIITDTPKKYYNQIKES